VTDASTALLHAVYRYRTLLMQAYFRGDALSTRQRANLAALDHSLGIDTNPTDTLPRQHKRVRVKMAAEILDGDQAILARAVNLGAGGVRVESATALPSHQIVTVRLDGPRDYRFPARLVWFARQRRDGFALGLVFVGAPVELRRRESYQRSRLAG